MTLPPPQSSFNPRPRVGGDLLDALAGVAPGVFQSAPPGGGRLPQPAHRRQHRAVSIRAPGWGATVADTKDGETLPVSIRAPGWGATPGCGSCPSPTSGFNPRPRVGGDDWGPASSLAVSRFQSAPPGGGRRGGVRVMRGGGRCFNPRPRVGGDTTVSMPPVPRTRFNPRPRVGGDMNPAERFMQAFPFQSAPPGGGRRWAMSAPPSTSWVSIRAPGWGATSTRMAGGTRRRFQSAPPGGGRRSRRTPARGGVRSFNPRPRVGGDLVAGVFGGGRSCFNPRPRVGGDVGGPLVCSTAPSFNPRPRVGGDTNGPLIRSMAGMFQSAPPGGGRRCHHAQTVRDRLVSIRAPGWGATPAADHASSPGVVSIRAPGWGATALV